MYEYEHIVLIGRPNVGKSTLFNRMVGNRRALVHHKPGTTRDRNEMLSSWNGRKFVLVDTGGWGDDDVLSSDIKKQMAAALENSSIVLLLVDGKSGFHPLDAELNNFLRRYKKKVLLIVNKIDTLKDEIKVSDFYRLGIEDPIAVSATHGINIHDLLDRIHALLDSSRSTGTGSKEHPYIKTTLIGKPNVGKSSLFNKLYKRERNIVNDKPGTTREAVDIIIKRDNKRFLLIDTPGLHKKRKFKNDIDYLSALSAQKALERTDIAVLIIDVEQGIVDTEAKIAELILKNHCACLIAVNKWDTVKDRDQQVRIIKQQLQHKLHFLWWCKLILISAKTGQRTEKIFDEVENIYQEFSKTVPVDKLRELIRHAQHARSFALHGKALRIVSVNQIGTCPPKFLFIVNDPKLVHFSFRRYFENLIRDTFGFYGTPIILLFKGKS